MLAGDKLSLRLKVYGYHILIFIISYLIQYLNRALEDNNQQKKNKTPTRQKDLLRHCESEISVPRDSQSFQNIGSEDDITKRQEQRESILQKVFEREHFGNFKLAVNLQRQGFIPSTSREGYLSPYSKLATPVNKKFAFSRQNTNNRDTIQTTKSCLALNTLKSGSMTQRPGADNYQKGSFHEATLNNYSKGTFHEANSIYQKEVTQQAISTQLNSLLKGKINIKDESSHKSQVSSVLENEIQDIFQDKHPKRHAYHLKRETGNEKSSSRETSKKSFFGHNITEGKDRTDNYSSCERSTDTFMITDKRSNQTMNSDQNYQSASTTQRNAVDSFTDINQSVLSNSSKKNPPFHLPNFFQAESVYSQVPYSSDTNNKGNKQVSFHQQINSIQTENRDQQEQHHLGSDQILKEFFPDLATQVKVPSSLEKKNQLQIKKKQERLEQYDQLFRELKNKRKTFSKFAFKSFEKQDNALIKPILEDLAEDIPKGTMGVIDLWSDKNIIKVIILFLLLKICWFDSSQAIASQSKISQ